MALEAPAHGQRRPLPEDVIFLGLAVTLLAFELGQDMAAVIELDEVVELVDPLPRDRLAVGCHVATQPLDLGARRLHYPVAAEYTSSTGGISAMGDYVRVAVTVETLDLELAGVAPVTEEDRLRQGPSYQPTSVSGSRENWAP